MADEQQRQALSAFSLLVDAANAQQLRSSRIVESNAVAVGSSTAASLPVPNKVSSTNGNNNYYNNTLGGGAAGMTLEERIAAIRQAALSNAYPQFQQQQQLQRVSDNNTGAVGAASSNLDAMEIQEALQRELLHRETLRRQQATALMGFSGGSIGAGTGLVGLGGSNNSYAAAAQEAEYLQQLRLEALVQQRRQETLAQLALAQELGMSPDMQAMLEAEQLRQVLMLRQEALLANSAAAAAATTNNGSGAVGGVEGILAALQGGGGGGSGITEEGILQILQERERQQKLALLLQAQQQQQQIFPQHVGSSPGLTPSQGHSLERADLIGSVFAKSHIATAAAATAVTEERERVQTLQQQLTAASASAAKVASSSKAEQQPPNAAAIIGQDRSRTTILPCRARGMPMDHNVKVRIRVHV
jgi:hypothetical protein